MTDKNRPTAADSGRRMLSGPQGTTTTTGGRAECDRRLLVHLLRAEPKQD